MTNPSLGYLQLEDPLLWPDPDFRIILNDPFRFWVPGLPEGAGSPTVFRQGKNFRLGWQKGPKWTAQIRKVLRDAIPEDERPLISGPASIWLEFAMPKPKKPRFPVPATKPDIDKLVRAVLDGLTYYNDNQKAMPLVLEDDARVVLCGVHERYALTTGVWIWVAPYAGS